ncbi:hypothetical protein EVAR_13183_1 [Eumeta japonica]|uniref:Uncharacterized protein n=1 Tax=Eumeta variegata TaxID=151549 RepID=A0A4C1TSJ4_EUMVA|nr:hypothetical protein EVAR_13183_1 [Eumeta japonica]
MGKLLRIYLQVCTAPSVRESDSHLAGFFFFRPRFDVFVASVTTAVVSSVDLKRDEYGTVYRAVPLPLGPLLKLGGLWPPAVKLKRQRLCSLWVCPAGLAWRSREECLYRAISFT